MAIPRSRLRLTGIALALALLPLGAASGASAPGDATGSIAAAHELQVPDSVTLTPSQPSPQPVETPITWTATVAAQAPGDLPEVYQFSMGASPTGPFLVQRDFSTQNTFVWAPLQEGAYYIQVTAKQGYTGTATTSAVASFTLSSRVTGGRPVVSATANPLVALYSAPACATGVMYVAFQQAGSSSWQHSNTERCVAGQSRNFLVAGMTQNTSYQMVNVLSSTTVVTSTPLNFTTGNIPSSLIFPAFTEPVPPGAQTDTAQGIVLHMFASSASPNYPNPVATNLNGQIVWYADERDLSSDVWSVRPQTVAGNLGNMMLLLGNDGLQPKGDDVLREIDLAGNPVQETNVQAINAQIMVRGDEIIYGFHHDATLLPNGDLAVLAQTQQVITTTPVMGDMLVVMNRNLQVVWTWDAFNFLDPTRGPTLGETCANDPANYCAVPGGPSTIDWLHTNAIAWSPADGNIVLSMRNQDWLVKINYANGNGSVLWRMGVGGDFAIVPLKPADPYPWFSHQHDLNYLNGATFELFDNGNLRFAALKCGVRHTAQCNSRGQVYSVNEQTKVVTQLVNANLGTYSSALGTAQLLSNGDYNFTAGLIASPTPPHAQDIEVKPNGTQTYVQQLSSAEYRAWRLATMDSSFLP